MKRIAILSDTHGLLRPEVLDRLEEAKLALVAVLEDMQQEESKN